MDKLFIHSFIHPPIHPLRPLYSHVFLLTVTLNISVMKCPAHDWKQFIKVTFRRPQQVWLSLFKRWNGGITPSFNR